MKSKDGFTTGDLESSFRLLPPYRPISITSSYPAFFSLVCSSLISYFLNVLWRMCLNPVTSCSPNEVALSDIYLSTVYFWLPRLPCRLCHHSSTPIQLLSRLGSALSAQPCPAIWQSNGFRAYWAPACTLHVLCSFHITGLKNSYLMATETLKKRKANFNRKVRNKIFLDRLVFATFPMWDSFSRDRVLNFNCILSL